MVNADIILCAFNPPQVELITYINIKLGIR